MEPYSARTPEQWPSGVTWMTTGYSQPSMVADLGVGALGLT